MVGVLGPAGRGSEVGVKDPGRDYGHGDDEDGCDDWRDGFSSVCLKTSLH